MGTARFRIIDADGHVMAPPGDRVLSAGDEPHPDHRWPGAVAHMPAMPLGERALRQILRDSPAAFCGLG